MTSYITLAHNLDSDECEWTVSNGVDALERAEFTLAKWTSRSGRWVGYIRPVGEVLIRSRDLPVRR
jgi:hypothetical protein